jgi:hypothetical protein
MKRVFLGAIAAFALWVITAVTVYAQTYYADVWILETGSTSYTMYAAQSPLNVTNLTTHNYITATGLDTRVQEGTTAVPHMLAADRVLFADAAAANSSQNYQFTTGNSALSNFYVITGHGGSITVTDAAALELGNNFMVEQSGFVDTSAGASKHLVYKQNAFRVYVSGASTIQATIGNDAAPTVTLTANGIASGEHIVNVTSDAVTVSLYVDSTLYQVAAAVVVPDNANNWTLCQNNVMPYMDYYEHTVSGTLIADYDPDSIISGTTLPDEQGGDQNGAITWGANPSGISVVFGSLTAYEDAAVDVGEAPSEVVPEISEIPGMHTADDPSTMGQNVNWLNATVTNMAALTNTPVQLFWYMGAVVFILLMTAATMRYTQSALLTGIALIAATALLVPMYILPAWIVLIAVAIALVIITMERSPSV